MISNPIPLAAFLHTITHIHKLRGDLWQLTDHNLNSDHSKHAEANL